MENLVYTFAQGDATMKSLLGGKGSGLAQMTQIGLPIPFGFTLTTKACQEFNLTKTIKNEQMLREIAQALKELEVHSGKTFASPTNPLLVSVRSGAAVSMPGMMDTILNLGLNDSITKMMAEDDPIFAYDLYRRFIQMFSNVVKDIPMALFDQIYNELFDGSASSLMKIVDSYKSLYLEHVGSELSQDPLDHLYASIEAVFLSWNNERAIYYRNMNQITDLIGTAVNVQEMVFGNRNELSATGVCFTRNPANGKKELYGEILWKAQGEDIVAGTHTPLEISDLKNRSPRLYDELLETSLNLEKHYGDMQDIEFTIDNNKLYILQTRSGKRTPQAALKILRDFVEEGVITQEQAIDRVALSDIDAALHASFDPSILKDTKALGKGLPASPGGAVGAIAFSKEKVLELTALGKEVLLVRAETSPEDIEGMHLALGILTSKGGMTSHAAVVTRGMGKPCIVGSNDLIFISDTQVQIGDHTYSEGDIISIDGSSGLIYDGAIALDTVTKNHDLDEILNYAMKNQALEVFVNADTPQDIMSAKEFRAGGVGLVRTEHMFFEKKRIQAVREMILSTNVEERKRALDKLIPFQKQDFKDLIVSVGSLPLTVRYLDPPLHEFLPTKDADIKEIAMEMDLSEESLRSTIASLHEFNPMMGHRGSRLAITYPEVYEMQTRAVIEAAIEAELEDSNLKTQLYLMLPLIGDVMELKYLREKVEAVIKEVSFELNHQLDVLIGTMIELPRACLLADEIAQYSDFISFGTNDLTQMTFGFSRDDINHFIHDYYDKGIYRLDPFATIDTVGVGALLKVAIEKARSIKPDIKIGVCGEHGGDPKSIEFFKTIGLDYISCSPYRLPLAITASAKK